jgi:hypothetical protein
VVKEAVPAERIPGYEARHRVRPGLTGLAQVYTPRDIPRRHKFRFDLLYIKKESFRMDLKLTRSPSGSPFAGSGNTGVASCDQGATCRLHRGFPEFLLRLRTDGDRAQS